jgi:hypothetical protein
MQLRPRPTKSKAQRAQQHTSQKQQQSQQQKQAHKQQQQQQQLRSTAATVMFSVGTTQHVQRTCFPAAEQPTEPLQDTAASAELQQQPAAADEQMQEQVDAAVQRPQSTAGSDSSMSDA